MANTTAPFTWKGEYAFLLSGSELHEDTLRINSNYRKQEQMLTLVLPTLCITYADSKFQDSVGGEQENFPASSAYGRHYFDPPIEILGQKDIEKFTYIRGAHRVEIGPEHTIIEFPSWRDLVIPRLRIGLKEPVRASLHVPDSQIAVDEPLQITALQYADGKHVGGVRLEKRHPQWKPPQKKETYSLWIRVMDGMTQKPLPEMKVDIWHWHEKVSTHYGTGGFYLDDRIYTDGKGCIQIPHRPSGELEAYVLNQPGLRAVVRCLRPLNGQSVRFHMRAWQLKSDTFAKKWQAGDKLDIVAQRTGHSFEHIHKLNGLKRLPEPIIGMPINLPCFAAIYHLEPWDTLDWVAETFGYKDAKGLAEANGFKNPVDLFVGSGVKLPDWRFYYANENDTLDEFDKMFGLPKGSSITVGRAFHPDPRLPYARETVAVPNPLFAEKKKRRRKRRR